MIIDRAVYRDGTRVAEPDDFAELHAACQARDAVAWLGLYEPSKEEFASVAREFDLHELAVEDAVKAHQRPKLERYGEDLFMACGRLATSTRRRRSCLARSRSSSVHGS